MKPEAALFDERDDLRRRAGRAQRLDALGDRGARADPQHGLRIGRGQLRHDGRVVGLVAIGQCQHGRLQLGLVEAAGRALHRVLAEGVVGLDHGDALHAHRVKVLDRLLGFALVAGAHVEHVLLQRLVQRHRAGRRADQRRAGLVEQGNDRERVGRAAVEQQRNDLLLLDQDARVLGRALGVEPVVHADHLDLLAVDAALRVHLVDHQLRARDGLLDAGRDRARHVGRLPDQDLRVRADASKGQRGSATENMHGLHDAPSSEGRTQERAAQSVCNC